MKSSFPTNQMINLFQLQPEDFVFSNRRSCSSNFSPSLQGRRRTVFSPSSLLFPSSTTSSTQEEQEGTSEVFTTPPLPVHQVVAAERIHYLRTWSTCRCCYAHLCLPNVNRCEECVANRAPPSSSSSSSSSDDDDDNGFSTTSSLEPTTTSLLDYYKNVVFTDQLTNRGAPCSPNKEDDPPQIIDRPHLQTSSSPPTTLVVVCCAKRCAQPSLQLDLLLCVKCRKASHAKCCDPPLRYAMVSRFPWTCTDCKACEACSSNKDEDSMLICDACDRAFHLQCIRPPLTQVPDGDWFCEACGYCACCDRKLTEREAHSPLCFYTNRSRLCIRCKQKYAPLNPRLNLYLPTPDQYAKLNLPPMADLTADQKAEAIATIGQVSNLCPVCIKPLKSGGPRWIDSTTTDDEKKIRGLEEDAVIDNITDEKEEGDGGAGNQELEMVRKKRRVNPELHRKCDDCDEVVHSECMGKDRCKICEEIRDSFTVT